MKKVRLAGYFTVMCNTTSITGKIPVNTGDGAIAGLHGQVSSGQLIPFRLRMAFIDRLEDEIAPTSAATLRH